MRILHLATFLQGGAGRAIVDLVREQQRAGHDVTVVASTGGVPGYGNYEQYLDELSSSGIVCPLVDSLFERSYPANLAAAAAIDRALPIGLEPHVIHAHAAIPSMVALLLAGIRRTPTGVLQTMHGWGMVKTAEQTATDVGLLNLVDRVVVPSMHSATVLSDLGVDLSQITIVPYGVRTDPSPLSDADLDTWLAMTRARRAGRLVVACVGTFGVRKNQTLLVEAAAALPHLDPLCVFIGDGDDTLLRETIARHGCADRVRLHGYSRSARALAAGADLLVLPSRSEGQPLSVLEAFCDGLLVAVSDAPELVELVDDAATGFTFRSEDATSLARTMTRIATLSNSARREIRAAARSRFQARFTLPRMAERYSELYEELQRRRASGPGKVSPAA